MKKFLLFTTFILTFLAVGISFSAHAAEVDLTVSQAMQGQENFCYDCGTISSVDFILENDCYITSTTQKMQLHSSNLSDCSVNFNDYNIFNNKNNLAHLKDFYELQQKSIGYNSNPRAP